MARPGADNWFAGVTRPVAFRLNAAPIIAGLVLVLVGR
jgi:hypothetical protein